MHGPGQGSNYGGCLPAAYDLIAHLRDPAMNDDPSVNAWCRLAQFAIGCFIGFLAAFLTSEAVLFVAATEGLGTIFAFLLGCIINAACAMATDRLNEAVDAMCTPCPKPKPDPRCVMLDDVLVGCLSGGLGMLDPFKGMLESELGGLLGGLATWGYGFVLNERCPKKSPSVE